MRRMALVGLWLLVGCSSAPVADLMDYCEPGHLPPNAQGYYGGVGNNLPPLPHSLPTIDEAPGFTTLPRMPGLPPGPSVGTPLPPVPALGEAGPR